MATGTTVATVAATRRGVNKKVYWAMVALGIAFALFMFLAVGYASTRK